MHQTGVDADEGNNPPPATLDVPALTRRMVEGNEAAYRNFHELYFQRLFRYLLVVARGDEDAAREALQSAFVRVVRHIKVFNDEARFWNWLTVLARTAFTDQRRKHTRYLAFLDRLLQHSRAESESAENGQADTQLFATLERSVQKLPVDERELVERKYFRREPVRDIAGSLQTSEKAVESRLVRVRRKLRDALLTELKHEQTD